jgi:hypothetical protein
LPRKRRRSSKEDSRRRATAAILITEQNVRKIERYCDLSTLKAVSNLTAEENAANSMALAV